MTEKRDIHKHVCCSTAANAVVLGDTSLFYHVLFIVIWHALDSLSQPCETVGKSIVDTVCHFRTKGVCVTKRLEKGLDLLERNALEYIVDQFVCHANFYLYIDALSFVLQFFYRRRPSVVLNSFYPFTIINDPPIVFHHIAKETRTRVKHEIGIFVQITVLIDMIFEFYGEWKPQKYIHNVFTM